MLADQTQGVAVRCHSQRVTACRRTTCRWTTSLRVDQAHYLANFHLAVFEHMEPKATEVRESQGSLIIAGL